MCALIGFEVCPTVIGLHVFTDCDSTRAFHGKRKRRPLDLVIKHTQYQKALTLHGKDSINSSLANFLCDLYGQINHDANETLIYCLNHTITASERSATIDEEDDNEDDFGDE